MGSARPAPAAASAASGAASARSTFFHGEGATVYLLTIYAKAEREDLTRADLRVWASLVEAIKTEQRR